MAIDTLSTAHRDPGWEKRFVYMLDDELSRPFDWVTSNCCDLMATAVMACHGPNHPILADLGQYTDEAGARLLLGTKGGLNALLGGYFEEVPKLHAFDADLATYEAPSGIVVGLVIMDGAAVGKRLPSEDPHNRIAFRMPILKCSKIFRV